MAAKSAPRPSLLSCSSSCSSFPRLTNSGFFFAPPPLFLSSSDNELSLMQIYSHVIPRCLPSADSRSIAQHHASKMSSLLHLASLDSQSWLASPSFANLSSEVINAVFGPWWLQLYFVWASICESRVSSNTGAKSSVDWHHVKKSPYSSRLTRLGLPLVVMGFYSQDSSSVLVRCILQCCHISPFMIEWWKKTRKEERSQFFTQSTQKGNVVPL